jgi:hypothetical protein
VDRKALKVAGRSGAPSSAAKLNHSAIDLGGSVRQERMPRIHAAEPESMPVLLVTCAVMPKLPG